MMPFDPIRDPMKRTMCNLRYIKRHCSDDGPYEVTQLVNSFLGALAHPWEHHKAQLKQMSLLEAEKKGWPILEKELPTDRDPKNLGDLLGLVRHSFAHGNIKFLGEDSCEITGLQFWNICEGKRTWGSVATVKQLGQFLDRFVELAKELPSSSGGA
jgi:HEPN pEK499 p136